ncbi:MULTISPECIES: sulfotransferase family protein [unclassified Nocardioides]|uniref:sulfotransferase family protein n=1 Tax=unclassified Nocardioides TaxID=2615069 RepID=UPI003616461B
MAEARRNAVLVLGAEASGPATVAGVLRILGMHAPTLEQDGSARWVPEMHERLLARANVATDDARPEAWFDAGRMSTQDQNRERVERWLDAVFTDEVDEIVVADAGLPWFLDLWAGAASRLDIDVAYVLTVTPPSEVISAGRDDRSPLGQAIAWLNFVLHTERATRGGRRVAIRQADLVEDWTVPIYSLGEQWGLRSVVEANARDLRAVHDYVDSAPRPGPTGDLLLPDPVQALVQSTGAALDRLAEGKDDDLLHRELDELRVAFIALYEQAAEIADSSVLAAERRLRRAKDRFEKERRELTRDRDQGGPSSRLPLRKGGRSWRRRPA